MGGNGGTIKGDPGGGEGGSICHQTLEQAESGGEHRASCMASSPNNLSSLVQELRDRIAAASSTSPNDGGRGGGGRIDDGTVEIRFRAVLPNLLNNYVVPSPSGGRYSLHVRSSVCSCVLMLDRERGSVCLWNLVNRLQC